MRFDGDKTMWRKPRLAFLSSILLALSPLAAAGADWPMWRCNAQRSAASPQELAASLYPLWQRELPPLEPAWPNDRRLQFDGVYQPVVMGKTLYYGSSRNDALVALDTETGNERWRFYADGPIRFAPATGKGKVYFTSDDGFLYCLNGADGKLLWKVQGGPAKRVLIGNERVISAWPARGGPALLDGVVYFAAGIWPFMGVFIHAVDAETGKVVWTNSDSHSIYSMVDHNFHDYVGVSPQGYCVAVEDKLIVPCGRSWPAAFNRKTGKLLYFQQGQKLRDSLGKNWHQRSWREGSWHVLANSRYIFNTLNHRGRNYQWSCGGGNWGGILSLASGALIEMTDRTNLVPELVLTRDALYGACGNVRAYRNTALQKTERVTWRGTGLAVQADGAVIPVTQATATHVERQTKRIPKIPDVVGIRQGWHRTLIKLDIGKVPQSPKQVLAALKPKWVRSSGKPARVTCHRMLRDWHQEATWKRPFPDKPETWDGLRPDKDYQREPFAVMHAPVTLRNKVYGIKGFADALANWKNGSWKNYGFVMILKGGAEQINLDMPKGARQKIATATGFMLPDLWSCDTRADILIKAGPRLYAGAPGEVKAIDIPERGGAPRVSWQAKINGTPRSLLAADGKLFAVTREGNIYCFGPRKGPQKTWPIDKARASAPPETSSMQAAEILKTTGVAEGYCLVLGIDDDRFVEQLVRGSKLHVIAVDKDAGKVAALRRHLDRAGLYGTRAAAFAADPASMDFAPYMAALIVAKDISAIGFHRRPSPGKLFDALRPYGGILCVRTPESRQEPFGLWVARAKTPNLKVSRAGEYAMVTRPGSLPGAGAWTHEYCDSARTLCSTDKLVKPPFGILWFGGPSENLCSRPFFTPRYYPAVQVIGGRFYVQSLRTLSALDVYTGRLLWQFPLPDPKEVFPVYHIRLPGYTCVSASDSIYIACGEVCKKLDPASGNKVGEFELPGKGRSGEKPYWGQMLAWKDLLIVTSAIPNRFWDKGYASVRKEDLTARELDRLTDWVDAMRKTGNIKKQKGESTEAMYNRVMARMLEGGALPNSFPPELRKALAKARKLSIETNDRLVVMDRITGRVLWTRDAVLGFTQIDNRLGNPRLGAVAAGNGKVFCLDSLHESRIRMLQRRGKHSDLKPAALALDVRTGKTLWTSSHNLLGKRWIAYSTRHDVVLVGTHGNIQAFKGADGTPLWAKNTPGNTFGRPSIIHDDVVITMFLQGDLSGRSLYTGTDTMHRAWKMLDLRTGKDRGEFRAAGAYCGFASASENLIPLRATSVAYYDFETSRVTNLPGFRGACSNNLIPADGVICAPMLAWHCMCNYPIATSLTLVHTPEADKWAKLPVQRERFKEVPAKKK